MPKSVRFSFIFLALLILSSSAMAGQYSTAFPAYLAEHDGEEMVTAIVTMADQVDLRALQDRLYAINADRRLWHETVVLALQAKATEDQADLSAYLSEQAALGNVEKYQGLWVGNIVIVTARPGVFDQIAARTDVDMVSPNYEIENIEPTSRGGDEPTLAGHEIGLERINADQCWSMGITGEGRLVSHLDTGVDGNHPALADRWAGNDPNYAGHPEWAWFDPLTGTNFPQDWGQHGTHTMGTICGRSETTSDTVGVAIDAHWISCGVIDRQSIQRTVDDALLSFQWIVDPDENPSTVWDVPDVNSNSWGVTTGHGYPPCDETFWIVLDGCEAAGIVVVFAAGNEGPSSQSLRRPADRATTDLTSFSVAALDGNNVNLPIADFSSRGPSFCTPDQTETFKPEVAAPGVNVRSSVPGGGYQGGWSGTSMACPHIAGIVALMRQANPNLTSEQVRQILLDTATDLGTEGEDNAYGMGIANAFEAVTRAMAYLEGWGTLGGVVTDQASGLPIQGAHVSVVGRPWGANTRANGQFFLFMPADTAWVVKVEHPPLHLPVFDTITVVENDTLLQNYALEGKVTVTLRASFANPQDASYRSFFLKGSWDTDGFWNAGWPAPAIEIKDDGVPPDQTAEDGIFTGQSLLARDMVHTYQWAIYSENYGGEASRLQNGADFQILDLTPPAVPTLAVNPSGSYNLWMISAIGNNGLNLDLAQGVDNRPTKWGAAAQLDSGLTYNFYFRVMHSNVASYGVGGVGGGQITFVCQFTGAYDFLFDDRDDSYVVQLTGTEGPPTYVTARSGLDHHVLVSWLPPGTLESRELFYDDGTLANAYYYYAYDNLMGNMFTPDSYPVTIDSVILHVLTEGDQYWPWPDGTADPVGISIFLDDGSGNPQPDPVYYTEGVVTPGEWIRVDIEEVLVDQGNFWVMMNNLDSGGDEGIGLDAATDYPANKWVREFGVWMPSDLYTGDHMLRVKVFGGARSEWLSVDSKPAQELPANIRQGGDLSATMGTGNANSTPNDSRLAYHPKSVASDPPIILDTEVLAGYHVYRGTSTGPYNRNELAHTGLIEVNSFDDWGDNIVPEGRLTNGTPYYYQVGAVYDIGGGQYVEVGPSNEAIGTPVNLAPQAPFNLAGGVVGWDIGITWSFFNLDRDWQHFNVYKRLMPTGSTVLVGTATDSAMTFTIPIGEDGVYKITVTATDDGSPALESVPSREIYLAVGHLPPGALVALSGYEFQVPLRWLLPGSWRAAAGSTPEREIQLPQPLDLSHKGEGGQNNPPVITDRGGPDAFGYSWIDSDEPDGPSYNWRDIIGIGEQIPMTNDDQNLGPFDIGFDVNYYGETYNQFFVCSNGWISFTSTDADYTNGPLPDPNAPLNMIAPFWDDLYPPSGGEYWYYSDGSELVVTYNNVVHIGSGGPYTFQIVLRASGSMIFQYQTLNEPTNQCTVGIQNADGSIGLTIAFDATYLHDEMAIRVATGPEGFFPAHFNLYRATTPNVPVDPGHLLNGNIAGDQTSYLDLSGIQNGQTYYYKLTAVWSDSVESPSSNEAAGTPANHQPESPYSLNGSVDDRNVTLRWSFTNLMGDFDHYNIYKKIVPGGTYALTGTSSDTTEVINIPAGQDGVWAFVITAVDNGAPQMESEYSNSVFFPVGNLPANNLRGTSNQEGFVPLAWSEPGMRPTTTITYDDGILTNAYYYYDYTNIMANQFVAGSPVEIETLWVHVLTEGDAYWPWPDGSADPVGITVFDDDGSGNPGDQVFYQETTVEPGQWIGVAIDGGLTLNGPNFWVGMQNLDGGGDEGIGLDAFSDYSQYKWNYAFGAWVQQDLYSGDHMIRATIVDNGRSLTLHESAPTKELALEKGAATFGDAVSVAIPGKVAVSSLSNSISDGDIPRPFDTEVLVGYSIYRATAPNVPIDDGHRLRSYINQGLATNYNDSAVVNGTTYYYKVTAVYDNNSVIEESPASNEISATPMMGGRMVLNPLFFNVSGQPGGIGSQTLNISNPGGLNLDWSAFAVTNQRSGADLMPRNAWSIDAGYGDRQVQDDKSNLPAEPTYPPMLLGRGGPDEFGYIWIDSDEPGGPTYEWIDITGIGEQLPITGDDENIGPYDIGFDFPFYGQIFNTIQICSNGFVSFTATGAPYTNYALPDPTAPLNMLAAFWDDLYPPTGGEFWYYSDGSEAVVSYINVPHIGSGGPYTFQVVLAANGSIRYNYAEINYPDDSATIGIQNGDGSIGLTVAYNQTYVHNDMTVLFVSSWLSADPSAGTVAPGGNSNINVVFDATFLNVGTYTGSLIVTGNDMNHQVGQVTIPVTFHVVTDEVGEPVDNLPKEFNLAQNYPNPFNPTTEIKFALPTRSFVTLEIINVLGQKVKTLAKGDMEPGYKSVIWDGTDMSGATVTSGTYFYTLKAGDKTFTKKMTMLK